MKEAVVLRTDFFFLPPHKEERLPEPPMLTLHATQVPAQERSSLERGGIHWKKVIMKVLELKDRKTVRRYKCVKM